MNGEFFVCNICKGSGKVWVSVKDPEVYGTGIGKYVCYCIECNGWGRIDWISYIKKDKPKQRYNTVIVEYQRFVENKEILMVDPYRPLYTYTKRFRELEWKDLHVQNVTVKEELKL